MYLPPFPHVTLVVDAISMSMAPEPSKMTGNLKDKWPEPSIEPVIERLALVAPEIDAFRTESAQMDSSEIEEPKNTLPPARRVQAVGVGDEEVKERAPEFVRVDCPPVIVVAR